MRWRAEKPPEFRSPPGWLIASTCRCNMCAKKRKDLVAARRSKASCFPASACCWSRILPPTAKARSTSSTRYARPVVPATIVSLSSSTTSTRRARKSSAILVSRCTHSRPGETCWQLPKQAAHSRQRCWPRSRSSSAIRPVGRSRTAEQLKQRSNIHLHGRSSWQKQNARRRQAGRKQKNQKKKQKTKRTIQNKTNKTTHNKKTSKLYPDYYNEYTWPCQSILFFYIF